MLKNKTYIDDACKMNERRGICIHCRNQYMSTRMNITATITLFIDAWIEHRHFFAEFLGFRGIYLLRGSCRRLRSELDDHMTWRQCNRNLCQPLLMNALRQALLSSSVHFLRKLLDHDKIMRVLCSQNAQKHIAERYKRPPIIHLALYHRNRESILMLASKMGESMAVVRNSTGDTCFHVAARMQDDTLQCLLRFMPEKSSMNLLNDAGETPLSTAIASKHLRNVQALMTFDVFAVTYINVLGHGAPIHDAAWSGGIECFKIVYGATFPCFRMSKCTYGYNALMIACLNENYEIVEFILDDMQDRSELHKVMRAQNTFGQTCLHLCVMNGNSQLLKLIVSKCPHDLLFIKNIAGIEPLEMALCQRSCIVADILRQAAIRPDLVG